MTGQGICGAARVLSVAAVDRTGSSVRRSIFAATLCAILLTFAVGDADGQSDPKPKAEKAQRSAASEQYDEILGQESRLTATIQRAEARHLRIQAALDRFTVQSVTAEEALRQAQGQLDRSRSIDRQAQATLVASRRAVVRAEAKQRHDAVASYVSGGRTDTLGVLIGAADGESATRIRAYAGAISRHQDDVVTQLRDARRFHGGAVRRAAAARRSARRRRDRISSARRLISTARADKARLLDELQRQILVEAVALNELQGRKALVLSRIASMNQVSDGIKLMLAGLKVQPASTLGDVRLVDPLPGAPLASPFGLRVHPILHITRLHAGVDFSAKTGTPIRAAADGVVVVAGVRGGYGNATVIDHGHGLATLYGHQSQILLTPGQVVRQGDVVGLVGSTGLSTGPHLHFETRLDGQPVDPLLFITIV